MSEDIEKANFEFDPDTNSFIAYDDGPKERRFLAGYAFSGKDLIIGNDGLSTWESANNTKFMGGSDGTYVIVSQSGNEIRIETDYAGHYPIFYFQDGRKAAASNSIVRLVEHLRRVGLRLSPNHAEVVARGTDFFPLHQLATFETAFSGIYLLPTGHSLLIKGGHCFVEPRIRHESVAYQNDLKSWIITWVDRISTILASGKFDLSVDLSGGLDSRVVFSLFHAVMMHAPPEWMQRIGIYSHGFLSPSDPEIAEKVLSTSESELRSDLKWRRFFSRPVNSNIPETSVANPLRRWWTTCGGIYSPNYMVSTQHSTQIAFFGGGGGEGYRNFYSNYFSSPSHLATVCQRHISILDHSEWLREGIISAFNAMESFRNDKINPMILHYREFRGRLHGGLRSRNRISFTPIASNLFEVAARSLQVDAMAQGQLFYDAISNCAPSLLGVRFDQEQKNLTPSVRERLASCDVERLKPQVGIVFGNQAILPKTKPEQVKKVDGLHQLAEAVDRATTQPYVQEVWDASSIQQARDMIKSAVAAGRFSHPNPACLISGILTAAMFD